MGVPRSTATAWRIRAEEPYEAAAIAGVVAQAFRASPYGDQGEAAIVDALRAAGALAVSLVAETQNDGAIVGHAALSPVTIGDGGFPGWFGLGPVAVSPDWQCRGIGAALVRTGLERLRSRGAAGCVVLGDPAYYRRFGFVHDPTCVFNGAPAEYLLVMRFDPAAAMPAGRVVYHPAFGVPG